MASSSFSVRTGDVPAGESGAIGGGSESIGEADWGRLEGRSNWAIAWRLGFVFKRTDAEPRLVREIADSE